MMQRRRVIGAAIAGAMLVIALSAVAVVAQPDPKRDRFENVAKARISGGDEKIGRISGIDVTKGDLEERAAAVQANLAYMKDQITAGDPAADGIREFATLIERSGINTVALAGTIVEMSLYSRAVDQGFKPDQSAVQDRVKQDREMIEKQGQAPEVKGYIDTIGKDKYWNEIYPAVVARDMTISKLVENKTASATTPSDKSSLRADLEREVVSGAQIEVSGDVAAALRYLDEYWKLQKA